MLPDHIEKTKIILLHFLPNPQEIMLKECLYQHNLQRP